MTEYRLYGLTDDDHIVNPSELIECESDEEAIVAAHRLLDRHRAAEVWQGARHVCRIERGSR